MQAKQERFEEEKRFEAGGNDFADVDPNARAMNQSKKAYAKELKKVIEASDVVIQVLDARDPEGCRSHDLEREVLS